MSKNTNFSGQPIFSQLLNFIDKSDVKKIGKRLKTERYVKQFCGYNHLVVMLFVAFENYDSLRDTVIGLLSNASKLTHLGLNYVVKRSTLSDANLRRSADFFGEVYFEIYKKWAYTLADSQLSKIDMKRLYIMDSTTISLFKDILKGVGKKPIEGKRKGGIKAHTIINAADNMPCFIRFSAASKHDHLLLKDVDIPKKSILCFDKGYVDYSQYEVFTNKTVWYVTRLKDNAKYLPDTELEISENAPSSILKDEKITLFFGEKQEHKSRRIAYWDETHQRIFIFLTNNFDLNAETIALIYKKRWQIELLFKQLKQNFPLKYFLGDNENAIKIQIWSVMIANLLVSIVKSKLKRKWAFSNMVSLIRHQLMSYINIYSFFENPEAAWNAVIKENKMKYHNSLFPI